MASVEHGYDKWWLPVFVAAISLPIDIIGGITIGLRGGFLGGDPATATSILWASVLVILFCSTIAVHFDRQYVSSISDWTPTRLYYLMFLGYLGMILAIVYVYRRHRIIGIP